MELCSAGHEEICYDSRDCPLCEAIRKHEKAIDEMKTEHENQVERLQDDIRSLELEITESKDES